MLKMSHKDLFHRYDFDHDNSSENLLSTNLVLVYLINL